MSNPGIADGLPLSRICVAEPTWGRLYLAGAAEPLPPLPALSPPERRHSLVPKASFHNQGSGRQRHGPLDQSTTPKDPPAGWWAQTWVDSCHRFGLDPTGPHWHNHRGRQVFASWPQLTPGPWSYIHWGPCEPLFVWPFNPGLICQQTNATFRFVLERNQYYLALHYVRCDYNNSYLKRWLASPGALCQSRLITSHPRGLQII